jgi:hypothetical protein
MYGEFIPAETKFGRGIVNEGKLVAGFKVDAVSANERSRLEQERDRVLSILSLYEMGKMSGVDDDSAFHRQQDLFNQVDGLNGTIRTGHIYVRRLQVSVRLFGTTKTWILPI